MDLMLESCSVLTSVMGIGPWHELKLTWSTHFIPLNVKSDWSLFPFQSDEGHDPKPV